MALKEQTNPCSAAKKLFSAQFRREMANKHLCSLFDLLEILFISAVPHTVVFGDSFKEENLCPCGGGVLMTCFADQISFLCQI